MYGIDQKYTWYMDIFAAVKSCPHNLDDATIPLK
jgi:hypothetical protein